jgi:hypothetical protein
MKKQKNLPRRFRPPAFVMIILFLFCSTIIASGSFEPTYKPTLKTVLAPARIDVDGNLTDEAWRLAGRAGNFVERYPGDMTEPEVKTDVLMTYDKDNLYVAFICHDDPRTLRATMCQRDQYGGDDCVALLIDPYATASWAYEFFVNPYGVQKDRLWSNVLGENAGFDMIWESAAQITDSGYQVEIAIPFASMRFPNKDVQSWRVDFWRNRPREELKQYSWAAYDRNEQCWVCQWGTVEGITDVHPGKGLELLGSLISNQIGRLSNQYDPDSRFDNGKILGEFSLGSKYAVSSDVTLEASYNPDFSQIEADAAPIDVNSPVALMYPERRPFFQEGSDIFMTLFNSFYSRTIRDPIFAAKMTGRMERTRFGVVTAADENTPYLIPLEEGNLIVNTGKSYMNVVRAAQSIGRSSMLGFVFSDHRLEGGGSGTVGAIDGNIRLSRNYSVVGQFILTHTTEPDKAGPTADFAGLTFDRGRRTAMFDGESYSGDAMITQFRRRARHWNFTLDYNHVSPSYRTETGYDPLNNYRNGSVMTSYSWQFEKGPFSDITAGVYTLRRWNYEGIRKIENNHLDLGFQTRYAQTGCNFSYSYNSELYEGIRFADLWNFGFDIYSTLSSQVSAGTMIRYGRGFSYFLPSHGYGHEIMYDARFELKPIDRLTLSPSFSFVRNTQVETKERLFQQAIFRTRAQIQINRQFSIRLVGQYNKTKLLYPTMYGIAQSVSERWDVDPLLTYRISSFSVLYLGSTHDYKNFAPESDGPGLWRMSARKFFMKIQYLFQT